MFLDAFHVGKFMLVTTFAGMCFWPHRSTSYKKIFLDYSIFLRMDSGWFDFLWTMHGMLLSLFYE